MGTCVIAADTLNEGYQSMQGGPERRRGEARGGRRTGGITAGKKVVEKKAKRETYRWADVQQTEQ